MSGKKNFSISFVTPPQNNGWIVVLCIEKKIRVAEDFSITMPSWKRINSFVCQNVLICKLTY